MATGKITLKAVETLQAKAVKRGKAQWLWDSGFGVRCSPAGAVSWQVQKWEGGRRGKGGKASRFVLGRCPPMSLDDARAKADKITSVKQALDAGTLKEVVDKYLDKKAKPGRYWTETTRLFNRDVFPKLGDSKIAKISKADIRDLIETKDKEAPGVARYLYDVLSAFFNWCADQDIISSSPMEKYKSPEPLQARDRILSDPEIKAAWKASCDLGWQFGGFYKLLLLTAQRREEVSGMHWTEIDQDNCTWTIPKERTKNKKPHIVHLSPLAMKIIRSLPVAGGDAQLVFTTTGNTPISGYSKAKVKLDKLLSDVPPWRVHDLRRTAASGMAKLGFQPHIVERVLNHVSGAQGGLIGVYQRYDYLEQRKQAIEAWGAYVERLVSEVSMGSNVVPLRVTA